MTAGAIASPGWHGSPSDLVTHLSLLFVACLFPVGAHSSLPCLSPSLSLSLLSHSSLSLSLFHSLSHSLSLSLGQTSKQHQDEALARRLLLTQVADRGVLPLDDSVEVRVWVEDCVGRSARDLLVCGTVERMAPPLRATASYKTLPPMLKLRPYSSTCSATHIVAHSRRVLSLPPHSCSPPLPLFTLPLSPTCMPPPRFTPPPDCPPAHRAAGHALRGSGPGRAAGAGRGARTARGAAGGGGATGEGACGCVCGPGRACGRARVREV